jgi:hypothetical protein
MIFSTADRLKKQDNKIIWGAANSAMNIQNKQKQF